MSLLLLMSLYLELAKLRGFRTQSSRLPTLLETFDTNSEELRSNCEVRGKNPQKTTLTSEMNCKFWMFPKPPSGSVIQYKDLWNLLEAFVLVLMVHYKERVQVKNQPKEEMHRAA